MAFDETLAEYVGAILSRKKGIAEKRMLGGIGFLLNGNLLVGIWKESLVVRLGVEEGEEALFLTPLVGRDGSADGRQAGRLAIRSW